MKKTVKRTAVLLTFALLLGAAAGCELRDASEEIWNEIAEETANVENTETETAGETSGRKTFEEILAAYREPAEADKENNTTVPAAEEKPSTGAAQEDTSEDASPSEPASDASSLSLVTADPFPGAGKTEAVSYDLYPKGLTQDEELFTERDLRQDADLTSAKALTVRDGFTILIEEEGVYVLSGTAENCTVTVDVDKSDKVQLVLNNVNITNDDFPAIYVISADKVFVTTAAGTENNLTVTGSFVKDSETGTNTDAVIYSKDDLVLNGTGSLTVTSYSGNGITSKDDLKATGGTWTIVSALDAIEANDSVCVCGGIFDISTNKDGLHCENDESLGFIWIGGGTWTIGAKSDGIQGTAYVQIDGGTFDINGSEGIEATYVQINGGTIVLYGSDDGINASRKSSAFTPTIEVNGGDLTVSVGQGDTDALDANGNIYVNGGTIRVTSTVSSFDYDGVAEFNGGTIIINGEEVDSIPQSMFGGPGGGFGGGRGGRGGDQGGFGGFGGFGGGQDDYGDFGNFGDYGDFGNFDDFGDFGDFGGWGGFGG